MMNIVFFGTPKTILPFLCSIYVFCIQNSYKLSGIICQPDKKESRGKLTQTRKIRSIAIELSIPVLQPEVIDDKFINWFTNQNIDLAIVIAYGKILPESLLNKSKFGFVNVHFSALPRWRGAAPIQRAIEAGDTKTGITIIDLDSKLDTGKIYKTLDLTINPLETVQNLFSKLTILGIPLLLNLILEFSKKKVPKYIQSYSGATYAKKISKKESTINWNQNSLDLINYCKAIQDWPGCHSYYNGKKIRFFDIQPYRETQTNKAAMILQNKQKLIIGTRSGAVLISRAQLENKQCLLINEFLNGFKINNHDYLKTQRE